MLSAVYARIYDLVLNAFRHHRGGHGVALRMSCSRSSVVLNAFRHHRGGHWRVASLGICMAVVLNAFRHHRGGHVTPSPPEPYSMAVCSTPFGITEGGIRCIVALRSRH